MVGWDGEDIAEAAAGVNDGLAGFLGCGDAGTWDDLRRAYGGDVGAAQSLGLACEAYGKRRNSSDLYVPGSREGRVEGACFARVVGPAGTLGLSAAFGAVSGDTIVTGRVQNGDTLHAELHIPEA